MTAEFDDLRSLLDRMVRTMSLSTSAALYLLRADQTRLIRLIANASETGELERAKELEIQRVKAGSVLVELAGLQVVLASDQPREGFLA